MRPVLFFDFYVFVCQHIFLRFRNDRAWVGLVN
jgi:hypothetical protein